MTRTTFTWGARTDVGRVREVNQDSVHAEDGLFVVADGMGGHRGGEVASAVAIETMVEAASGPGTIDQMIERVRAAHQAVLDRADADPSLTGMGTTVCAVARLDEAGRPGMLGLINVGDSRIYHYADDRLAQLSEDHSLVGDLQRAGHLTPEEAANHPQRNIVTRALGVGDQLLVDYWEVPAVPGDHYLLCSDGLVDEVGDEVIASVLRRLEAPIEIVDELVRLALEAGARDNVTVLVVRVDESAVDDDDDPAEVLVAPSTAGPADDVVEGFADTGPLVEPDSPYPSRVPLEEEPPARSGRGRRSGDRGPRMANRGIGILVAVLLVLLVSVWLLGAYGRNNYFVGFENDQVVVYQGRPGGFLWFDPTVEDGGTLRRGELTDALAQEVGANPEFGSLGDAQDYVTELESRVDAAASVGSSTAQG